MGKLLRRAGEEIELHVRQLAWLHATPRPRGGADGGFEPEPRIRRYRDDGTDLPLPPCPFPALVALLFEAGPAIPTGQGPAALSWRELESWVRQSGARVRKWDLAQLKRLSGAYLGELHEAGSETCPAPWWPGEDGADDGVRGAFERLFGR